jgi:UDP-3-O-[3-hydroxymyristoyl] glucosamine N-acyltransferase
MRVSDIAQLIGGRVSGDGSQEIRGVAGLEAAGPEDLSFADGPRALEVMCSSKAGCVLVMAGVEGAGRTTIAVPNPKWAFVRATAGLVPARPVEPGIHPSAVVHAEAEVADSARVGPCAVVGRHVRVGERTRIEAGVTLGEGVEIGADCFFHPHVTVYPGARIGNRVILHAGVVIGSDGFGYVFAEGRHHKFPQVGALVIEDDVEVGSNTTIDRGSLGTTVIGEGTKIDNLVQIAHNVRIGRHSVIAAQTGISGSAEIGNFVVMAGQVGVGPRARIEDNSVIAGQSGVLDGKTVRKGSTLWGTPARPIAQIKKIYASLANLPDLARTVEELRQHALRRAE